MDRAETGIEIYIRDEMKIKNEDFSFYFSFTDDAVKAVVAKEAMKMSEWVRVMNYHELMVQNYDDDFYMIMWEYNESIYQYNREQYEYCFSKRIREREREKSSGVNWIVDCEIRDVNVSSVKWAF